jgi:hypothetical protein
MNTFEESIKNTILDLQLDLKEEDEFRNDLSKYINGVAKHANGDVKKRKTSDSTFPPPKQTRLESHIDGYECSHERKLKVFWNHESEQEQPDSKRNYPYNSTLGHVSDKPGQSEANQNEDESIGATCNDEQAHPKDPGCHSENDNHLPQEPRSNADSSIKFPSTLTSMISASPNSGKQKQLADTHSKTQKKNFRGKKAAENIDIASAVCYNAHNFTKAILKVCSCPTIAPRVDCTVVDINQYYDFC